MKNVQYGCFLKASIFYGYPFIVDKMIDKFYKYAIIPGQPKRLI